MEFEQERDALERIRNASNQMEKRQSERKSTKEDDLDVIPTKESNRSHKSTAASKKQQMSSYRPDRVKSSIPKFSAAAPPTAPVKQVITIPFGQTIVMQKAEVERAVKMQREEEVAKESIRRLRDHPNEHINELQNEVALLSRKMDPLLKRVEEAARNVQIAG